MFSTKLRISQIPSHSSDHQLTSKYFLMTLALQPYLTEVVSITLLNVALNLGHSAYVLHLWVCLKRTSSSCNASSFNLWWESFLPFLLGGLLFPHLERAWIIWNWQSLMMIIGQTIPKIMTWSHNNISIWYILPCFNAFLSANDLSIIAIVGIHAFKLMMWCALCMRLDIWAADWNLSLLRVSELSWSLLSVFHSLEIMLLTTKKMSMLFYSIFHSLEEGN